MKHFDAHLISRHVLLAIMISCAAGCGTGYRRIDGKWCYVTIDAGNGRQARQLAADTDSFGVCADRKYAKDKNSVFFKGRNVANAHAPTFEAIPQSTSPLTSYSKDANRVFLDRLEILGADPGSFRVIEGPYSRDGQRIYCGCVPMDVAHPEEFEVVFWSGIMETGGDVLVESYGEAFSEIEGAVIVGLGWSRDGEYYYFGPRRVTDRDYATIEVIDNWEARDKDGVFCGDLQIQAIRAAKRTQTQNTSLTEVEQVPLGL